MPLKTNVTARLSFASFILLALFLVLAAAAYFSGRKVERESRLIREDAVPGSIDASAMRIALGTNMRHVSEGLITEDDDDKRTNLKQTHLDDAVFAQAMERYLTTIRIEPMRDRMLLDRLTARFAEFVRKRNALEAQLAVSDRATEQALFEHEVLPAFTAAAKAADDLVAYNHANGVAFADAIARHIQTLRWTVIVILGLAIICGAILVTNLAIRRLEQKEFSENAHRLRLTLDNLHSAVVLCAPDGTVVEANQAALASAGCRREAVLGQPFHAIDWWPRSREFQAKLQVALRVAAADRRMRFDLSGANGAGNDRAVTIDFSCSPVHADDGRLIHLVAAWNDISDRKKLEQHLLRSQRMEAIGTLSSGLAHDLNNILAPMVIAGGLLRMKLTTPREIRLVTLIENGVERGANIIRQMLRFGQETDGTKSKIELRHLIKEMTQLIQETFPRSIELTSTTAVGVWPILAEVTQLHQMLLNLCLNARDAMPRGGRLSILVHNIELDDAQAREIPQAMPGRYVRLTVADTGEGIPYAIINRIFDPFFTTKPEDKGTGLGLSSVLGIVKGHGGFLTVASEPGKGSTFTIYLPAAEQAEPVRRADPPAHPLRGHGETILLVDDEVAVREATREILELHNYQIIAASSGDEALKLYMANRHLVKLVLTDLDMPVMNGPELIRSLRVLESDLKCVVMTDSMTGETREELNRFELDHIIAKPCEPTQLLNALHEMLNAIPAQS